VSKHNKRRLAGCATAAFLVGVTFTSQSENDSTPPSLTASLARLSFLRAKRDSVTASEDSAISSTDNYTPVAPERDNQTWAVLKDFNTNEEWFIKKRSLHDYLAVWGDIVDQQYTAEDPERQVDLVNGIGFAGVLEMEDGRDPLCLISLFDKWQAQEPFSGVPFFRWVDHGTGRSIQDDGSCNRIRLDKRRYAFFDETEIEESVVNLRVVQKMTNDSTTAGMEEKVEAVFVQSGESVPPGKWLSIWGINQKLHVFQETHVPAPENEPFDYWKQGHCSVTRGRPVLYAGEIEIGSKGDIVTIGPKSGQ